MMQPILFIMLRNFFLIALRNITKRPGFTLINITGLAVGLASSMLLLMWVMDELGYERFNTRADRIYRIEEDQFYSGQRYHVTVTPFPSGPEWKEKIPEIEEQVRIFPWMPRMLFRNGEKVSYETSVIAADQPFLKYSHLISLRVTPVLCSMILIQFCLLRNLLPNISGRRVLSGNQFLLRISISLL